MKEDQKSVTLQVTVVRLKICCFFILTAIFFCADSRCLLLMHLLIADTIVAPYTWSNLESHRCFLIILMFLKHYLCLPLHNHQYIRLKEILWIYQLTIRIFYIVMSMYLRETGRVAGMTLPFKRSITWICKRERWEWHGNWHTTSTITSQWFWVTYCIGEYIS